MATFFYIVAALSAACLVLGFALALGAPAGAGLPLAVATLITLLCLFAGAVLRRLERIASELRISNNKGL